MAMACSIITACSGYPPHSRLTTPIKSAHTFYSLKCSINMLHWSSSQRLGIIKKGGHYLEDEKLLLG